MAPFELVFRKKFGFGPAGFCIGGGFTTRGRDYKNIIDAVDVYDRFSNIRSMVPECNRRDSCQASDLESKPTDEVPGPVDLHAQGPLIEITKELRW